MSRQPPIASSMPDASLTPEFIKSVQESTSAVPIMTITHTPTPQGDTTSIETKIETPTTIPTPTRVDIVYEDFGVELPGECYGELRLKELTERLYTGKFEPCSDFKYSPDKQYLGFFFGPRLCGRGIIMLHVETSEIVYRSRSRYGHRFQYLPNGKIIISSTGGNCEASGGTSLLDPITREMKNLGGFGIDSAIWNRNKTAFLVHTRPYYGYESDFWLYNVEKDFNFSTYSDIPEINDNPIWADESYVLYEHRIISATTDSHLAYAFPHPRQIVRVNATTGEEKILASDPKFDYSFERSTRYKCNRYGNWMTVRRIPFVPKTEPYIYTQTDDSPEIACLAFGHCTDAYELLVLNWRTEELLAWDETDSAITTAISTCGGRLVELSPDISSSLNYTLSKDILIQVDFPENLISEPAIAEFRSGLDFDIGETELVFTGISFSLFIDGKDISWKSFKFNQPVPVTIYYPEKIIVPGKIIELHRHIGSGRWEAMDTIHKPIVSQTGHMERYSMDVLNFQTGYYALFAIESE